ncbi:MAG: redoxin domain-containing protein [Gemmatimonadetes bacterium]|nr:redoxin domain-containing protein [Gemmatimonadota bacterium]
MRSVSSLALAAVLGVPAAVAAQGTDVPPPLEIGAVAPDFTLPGATRHGVLQEEINLRDYAGKTVVLAFFFRARTRG